MVSSVRRSVSLWLVLALVAWALVGVAIPAERAPAAAAPGGTPEIMLLGNSITLGTDSTGTVGFRQPLYASLTASGHSFDFVGSLTSGTTPPSFDRNHEGHSGYRADQIRDGITGWLNSNPADIVALHIGTNDISQGQSAASTAAEITEILDLIDTWEATNRPVWVILSRIINRDDSYVAETSALNLLIQSLADARIAAGDRILVVDMEAALDYPADLDDNVHPNDSGYAKMAVVYDEAIDALIDGPTVANVGLTSSPVGGGAVSDDLSCDSQLGFEATTAVTVWSIDGSPLASVVLPMEGGEPAALQDVSGNGLAAATKVGDPTWFATAGSGGDNGAYAFDGNDSLVVGDVFPTGGSYTKSAWIYKDGDGTGSGNNILSGNTEGGGHAFWVPDFGSTYSGSYLSAGNNGRWNAVKDSVPLVDGVWYHVAVTFDSTTGLMTLYKNGASVNSATLPIGERNVTDPTLQVGSYNNSYNWNGTIDDVRVYPVALTADQIAAVAGAGGDSVIVLDETSVGEDWQCSVTPFSADAAGVAVASNALTITPGGAPTYSVTYDGNTNTGGSVPVDAFNPYVSGSTVTVLGNTGNLEKSGFAFDGWNTAANGSGTDYAPAATFSITANTTLFAQWETVVAPTVSGVALSSSPVGGGLASDDLSCAFTLGASASTAATAWSVDGSPLATLVVPMEGGASSALADVSGNGQSIATTNGDPTWSSTAGHDGNGAFVFDGSGDDLDAGEIFPLASSYTKSAWVYRTGSGANGGNNIISGDINVGGHAFWAPDTYANQLSAGHNQEWDFVQDSVPLALNTWYHVAVTFDYATGEMKLYKNGALVDSGTIVAPGPEPLGTAVRNVTDPTISIGSFGASGYNWQGTIDDVRVYPVALSADQIASIAGSGGDAVIVAAETTVGEDWLCAVTPFSAAAPGSSVASNTLTITGPDVTDPVVTITSPLDGAEFDQGAAVTVAYSCTDAGSGIASCVGDVANGALLDTSSLGAQTFTVVGTDNATNSTTVVHDYTVVAAPTPVALDAFVIGGTSAVASSVATQLEGLVSGTVTRISGANRYATAAAVSAAKFKPGVTSVYIATGEDFPDALAAGAPAGVEDSPILLVRPTSLPSETAAELARLKPGRIIVVGGTAVVSDSVLAQLGAYTSGAVLRVAGANRYATAAAVSALMFKPGVAVAYVATGENFPDALAGGPAGVVEGGPILLTRQGSLPGETAAELARLKPARIVVLGGTVAVSSTVAGQLAAYTSGSVSRYAGANRYETAAAVSQGVFPSGTDVVFIVTGTNFPDAMAAGPIAGMLGGPILLDGGGATLPSATVAEITRLGK